VNEISVRRARPGDLDALLELYGELVQEQAAAAAEERDAVALVLERILAEPTRHLLVAELQGRVIGTLDVVIVANLTHHGMPWAIIENVVVAAEARRSGAGRALFGRVLEIAEEAGCYKVQLLSGKHRLQAHTFYRSVGLDALAEGFKVYLDG